MSHPKQRHGHHTWDLVLHYVRCPFCGYIAENRDKYISYLDRIEKEVKCPRCEKSFKLKKETPPSFGPLLGHKEDVDE